MDVPLLPAGVRYSLRVLMIDMQYLRLDASGQRAGVEAGVVRTDAHADRGTTGGTTDRAIAANEREQAVIDEDHGWEAREIGGKASAIVTCELCGRPIDRATPLDDDKAIFGDPENTTLLCGDCRGIQARSEEPVLEPDEDQQR